ncbi:MAG: hypothetical protein FD149_939 [Rhodospirillaceae bacterium]|nr:MAG: hypothetical protein FD149_939 [Rhodospirillaceae bacterium]
MLVCHLIIFARFPRLGTVKTRLAADIGAVAALGFQRTLFAGTLYRVGRDRRWRTVLAITPDRSRPWPRGWVHFGQGPGDLGQRMARAMRMQPPGPVVIVGCDIPALRRHHIAAAFRALGDHDVVFGPATDGGYWLVGVRRRPRFCDPFRMVRWSSPHALADTVANLAGKRFVFMETLDDVDDGPAFFRYRRHSQEMRGCGGG